MTKRQKSKKAKARTSRALYACGTCGRVTQFSDAVCEPELLER